MSTDNDQVTPEQERQNAETAFAAVSEDALLPPVVAEAKEATPEATPDPWEGVSPVLRQQFEAQADMLSKIGKQLGGLDTLTHEVRTQGGRIAAIQREQAAAQAAARQVKDAPTQTQIVAASKTPEKWNQLKTDFPVWTEAMEEMLGVRFAAERAELLKALPAAEKVDVEVIKKDVATGITTTFADAIRQAEHRARREAITEARALQRIDAKHEGWEGIINSKEFIEWSYSGGPSEQDRARYFSLKRAADDLENAGKFQEARTAQTQAVAVYANFARTHPQWWAERGALMDSAKPEDAIKVLDAYSEHQKAEATRQKSQQRLQAAVPARGTQAQRQPTQSEREAEEKAFAAA